ncbi:MAG: VWA domain-containing protein [Marinicaulis sp.]|nr:VWA domain-containing protein [Marinicaulis sp.]
MLSHLKLLASAGLATATIQLAGAQETDATAQTEPSAQDAQSVMMVLDGSGSMWGQIDGVTKIEIARDVIGGLLDGWDTNVHLGLVAYGHREKGVCSDIETVMDVGPVSKDAVMAKINAINPKGKTPISASVRQAADALKYTEEKATVILVSDGIETCEADPCALASELEENGVDFTAHVIGFDVAETDRAKLSCLAENTGGKFFSAANAGELTTALVETVEAVKEPEPKPEPEVAEEQGVKFSAKLCESCDNIEAGLYWEVFESEQSLDGKRKRLEAKGGAAPFVTLAAGEYYMTVKHGDAKLGEAFVVEPNKTTQHVAVFDAGNLRLSPVATEGGEKLTEKMYYRVYDAKTDLAGKRNQIAASGSVEPLFTLTAGEYVVEASHGKAKIEVPVTVTAGELTDATANLNVGYLKVLTTMADGMEPLDDDVYYRVLSGKADLSGKREQIDASGSDAPLFRLPAGAYVIKTQHGKAVVEQPVTVTAGSLTETLVVQNSARVKTTVTYSAGGPAVDDGVYWRVFEAEESLDGKRKQVDASGAGEPVFALPAGDYVAHAKIGAAEAETAFTLAPGDEKAVEVVINKE